MQILGCQTLFDFVNNQVGDFGRFAIYEFAASSFFVYIHTYNNASFFVWKL